MRDRGWTVIRSFGFLLSGNACAAAILLLRTVVVSRLISLEDFGIGTSLVLALAMIEMLTALGFQQQIVNAPKGDDADFHSALHGVALIRGMIGAAALFLLAPLLARSFGVEQLIWAFQLISVVPLLQGAMHLDVYRQTRHHKHRAAIWIALLPPLGSLAALLPLSRMFDDFRIMLFAVLVHMALGTLVSHAVAKRPYRLRFDRTVMVQSMRFGWPLMASGVVMFLVFNGERAIVGRLLGLEALALFSMAVSLTLTPSLVLMRSTMSLFLPRLSASAARPEFRAQAITTIQSHIVLAAGMVMAVNLLGGSFVHHVLGDKYRAVLPLLTLLTAVQALRVVKGGCAIVALGEGYRKTELLTDLLRIAFLPLAAWGVLQGASLPHVVHIAGLGEAAGLMIALLWMHRVQQVPLRPLAPPLICMVAVLAWAVFTQDQPTGVRAAGFGLLLAGLAMVLPDVRRIIFTKGAPDGMDPKAIQHR